MKIYDLISLNKILCGSLRFNYQEASLSNKDVELFYLKEFIDKYQDEITIIEQCESPDFICRVNGLKVGVEVTELKNPTLKEISGIQRKILRNASVLAADIFPLNVKVYFHDASVGYKQKNQNKISQFIYQKVLNSLDEIKALDGSSYRIELGSYAESYGIGVITASWGMCKGVQWLDKHRWVTIEPGFIRRKFDAELKERIDNKNSKYDTYLEKCDTCWLLIVANRRYKDQMFEYELNDSNCAFESKFDKCIYFEVSDKDLHVLPILPVPTT